MKRMLALLLSVLLVVTSLPVLAETAEAAAETALPQVGEVVHGFEVVECLTDNGWCGLAVRKA